MAAEEKDIVSALPESDHPNPINLELIEDGEDQAKIVYDFTESELTSAKSNMSKIYYKTRAFLKDFK